MRGNQPDHPGTNEWKQSEGPLLGHLVQLIPLRWSLFETGGSQGGAGGGRLRQSGLSGVAELWEAGWWVVEKLVHINGLVTLEKERSWIKVLASNYKGTGRNQGSLELATVHWRCAAGGSGCESGCWLQPMHCRCVDRHCSSQQECHAQPHQSTFEKHSAKTHHRTGHHKVRSKTQLFALTADKPKTFHIRLTSGVSNVCRHRLLINGPRSDGKKRNTAAAEAREDTIACHAVFY